MSLVRAMHTKNTEKACKEKKEVQKPSKDRASKGTVSKIYKKSYLHLRAFMEFLKLCSLITYCCEKNIKKHFNGFYNGKTKPAFQEPLSFSLQCTYYARYPIPVVL